MFHVMLLLSYTAIAVTKNPATYFNVQRNIAKFIIYIFFNLTSYVDPAVKKALTV